MTLAGVALSSHRRDGCELHQPVEQPFLHREAIQSRRDTGPVNHPSQSWGTLMISILLIGGLALLLATSLGAVIGPDERPGTGGRHWV